MDTTEQYVKMCEKAKEIQERYNPDEHNCLWDGALRWDWDRERLEYDGYRDYGGSKLHIFKSYDSYLWHCIWLPRQDQLQEMVLGYWREMGWEVDTRRLIDEFNYFVGVQLLSVVRISSMEQLLLAFVMKEKHGKTRDGTEWVKESTTASREAVVT